MYITGVPARGAAWGQAPCCDKPMFASGGCEAPSPPLPLDGVDGAAVRKVLEQFVTLPPFWCFVFSVELEGEYWHNKPSLTRPQW